MNKIFFGDCYEYLIDLPENYVDYTITSPPYNANTVKGKTKYLNLNDNLSQLQYFEWCKKIILQLIRVSKHEVFFNIQMLANNKIAVCRLIGEFAENIKEIIIWDKKNGEPAIEKGVLNSVWEYVIVFAKNNSDKRKFYSANFHGTVDNIIRHKKQSGNQIVELNSATFPTDLVRKILLNFTKENDLILDPFIGSGTTAIACIIEKRKYLGYELDKQTFDFAIRRIELELSNLKLF
jgi:site-specific DNA-methyltransferase (adenine-specific)